MSPQQHGTPFWGQGGPAGLGPPPPCAAWGLALEGMEVRAPGGAWPRGWAGGAQGSHQANSALWGPQQQQVVDVWEVGEWVNAGRGQG